MKNKVLVHFSNRHRTKDTHRVPNTSTYSGTINEKYGSSYPSTYGGTIQEKYGSSGSKIMVAPASLRMAEPYKKNMAALGPACGFDIT